VLALDLLGSIGLSRDGFAKLLPGSVVRACQLASLAGVRGIFYSRTPPSFLRTAGCLGAVQADEITYAPSTGFAMTMAAKNVGETLTRRAEPHHSHKRRTVVVLHDQMASNVYPWQRLCSEKGLWRLHLRLFSMGGLFASLFVEELR
jgi:hypothetical protein